MILEIQSRGFNSQPEALELYFTQLVPVGSWNVYLSDTRIYLTLKNLSVDNECKCQILSLINWVLVAQWLERLTEDQKISGSVITFRLFWVCDKINLEQQTFYFTKLQVNLIYIC